MGAERRYPEVGGADSGSALLELATSTARFLLGEWIVVREIQDHRAGQSGLFRGTAQFVAVPRGSAGLVLSYREHGELTFGGRHGPASRHLCLRERSDGAADVLFADGRALYRLDLGAGYCEAEHRCGPDRYLVHLHVLSGDTFTETWQVTGQAKDYEMTTSYVRTGSLE